ncbi:MAG: helix-turn-helix domain-containing protein [Pirellulaceae bacterium]|nr:helix-turn-helix domain-containing protein [Pirellulaceae bacterium]
MQSNPPKPTLLLTATQAAEALAISPRKLWGMTQSGQVPHIRLGRCLRYPADDLRLWIDAQKKGGDSQ